MPSFSLWSQGTKCKLYKFNFSFLDWLVNRCARLLYVQVQVLPSLAAILKWTRLLGYVVCQLWLYQEVSKCLYRKVLAGAILRGIFKYSFCQDRNDTIFIPLEVLEPWLGQILSHVCHRIPVIFYLDPGVSTKSETETLVVSA